MTRSMSIALAVAAMAAFGLSARASSTYDTTLASPNGNTANTTNNPSWYDGSGNNTVQGGFTVDSENGIEIGMRAKYRQNANWIDPTGNVYSVAPGAQTNITSGGAGANAARAAWNYEFSIDLQPGGLGGGGSGLTLADIAANTTLTITDLTTGHTSTVNPLTHWGDDTGYGHAIGFTLAAKGTPEVASDWGVQQSENPAFADFPLAAFYNMNAPDSYQFTLNVVKNDETVLGSDTIFVNVAPLPTSAGVGFAMLAGLGAIFGLRNIRSRRSQV